MLKAARGFVSAAGRFVTWPGRATTFSAVADTIGEESPYNCRVTDQTAALPVDIVARLRAGDERALEIVFRAYYSALASFAFRYLRDAAASEDVVQDTFAALWTSRDRITVSTSLRAYLYGAVRNRALNIRKHEAVVEEWERDESSDDVRTLHAPPAQPDELLERRLRSQELAEAFESLPERQAQVMLLRWRDGLSYAEIAAALDISVKGVEKHLSRGLEAFRRLMR